MLIPTPILIGVPLLGLAALAYYEWSKSQQPATSTGPGASKTTATGPGSSTATHNPSQPQLPPQQGQAPPMTTHVPGIPVVSSHAPISTGPGPAQIPSSGIRSGPGGVVFTGPAVPATAPGVTLSTIPAPSQPLTPPPSSPPPSPPSGAAGLTEAQVLAMAQLPLSQMLNQLQAADWALAQGQYSTAVTGYQQAALFASVSLSPLMSAASRSMMAPIAAALSAVVPFGSSPNSSSGNAAQTFAWALYTQYASALSS